MHCDLPQELRDHINKFFVEGSYDNEVIVRQANGNKMAYYVRQPLNADSYLWMEDPFFAQLRADCFGRRNTRDLLIAYYRSRTFKFAHRELGLVRAFLDTDELGLRARPLDHIRRLHLEVEPFLICSSRDEKTSDIDVEICRATLEGIAAAQAPHITTVIHLNLAQDILDGHVEQSLSSAASVVLEIAAIVTALIEQGVKIEVILEGVWDKSGGLKCLCFNQIYWPWREMDYGLGHVRTSQLVSPGERTRSHNIG
ncbi:uncharacterized protein CC84DRAFT_1243536 [Paraphaeosphaeria sporulosa]|uniref:Uncharacterized protein n=1 Tax=Paraphaeosphaeria sporulosa TaxID=1460663 RepID=A0A177CLQ3_9PLEO|nr:uncharacterized protein CC84DRAFT_1243536 [Paraphaeosphaeria sporulosa]OAG07798.1 hypothetical protein CC84DRAFT_1243536 [Paraphaeosphaeria sporulosa]